MGLSVVVSQHRLNHKWLISLNFFSGQTLNSDDADDLERLTNLMSLIRIGARVGSLNADTAQVEKRTSSLNSALEKIIADISRPNNSLHAKSLLLLGRISERMSADPEDTLVDIWAEFEDVFAEAEGLGAFPFGSVADVLTELGSSIPESEQFDALYNAMTDALAIRRSEGEAAKRNSERGFQKLSKNLPYDAIRWFGKSVGLLIKDEYEDDLINALIGCSLSFQRAGLPWAARNYALAAASQQFAAFRRTGSIESVNPGVVHQLLRAEFQLGRIPNILTIYQLDSIVRSARSRSGEQLRLRV